MECKLEEKDPMNAVGNTFIFFFFFFLDEITCLWKDSESWYVEEYSQIRAKVLLMQSKKLSNYFATRSFNLALASWKESTRDVITVGKSDKRQTNSFK